MDLKPKQGYIHASFIYSDLEGDYTVFVDIPMGFRDKSKVIKINKTLNGLHQSSRAFWIFLTNKMKLCVMYKTQLDPWFFAGEKLICICCVDDLIFWSKMSQILMIYKTFLSVLEWIYNKKDILQVFLVSECYIMVILGCSN